MSKSKRSLQLDQDISEILSGSPAHDSTKKPTSTRKRRRSSTSDKEVIKNAKRKKSTTRSTAKKKSKSTQDSGTKPSKEQLKRSPKVNHHKTTSTKRRTSTNRRQNRKSHQFIANDSYSRSIPERLWWPLLFPESWQHHHCFIFPIYLHKETFTWLSPQVASVQQKDLGRLYSAPLSYWKGLPFSIEEVVEDLRMAGYDQVDFQRWNKGDFGYSKQGWTYYYRWWTKYILLVDSKSIKS